MAGASARCGEIGPNGQLRRGNQPAEKQRRFVIRVPAGFGICGERQEEYELSRYYKKSPIAAGQFVPLRNTG
jgi:hypothetical protein